MYEIKKQNVHILCTEKYLSSLYLNQETSFMYVSTENLKRKIMGTAFLTPVFEFFNFYSTLRFAIVT